MSKKVAVLSAILLSAGFGLLEPSLPAEAWGQGQSQLFLASENVMPLLERTARLSVNDVSLERAFDALEARTGIRLVYSPSRLPSTLVSCDCYSLKVAEALDLLLRGVDLRYAEQGEYVIIESSARVDRPAFGRLIPTLVFPSGPMRAVALGARHDPRPVESRTPRPVVPAVGTITGTVMDGMTLRPIPAVQVFIESLERGVLTDPQGRFTLANIPDGRYVLSASLIGYVPATTEVVVGTGETTAVEFRLTQRALALNEIVATGVVAETPRTQLPFTVDRVDFSREMAVVPVSPEALLQGRVAGATITRGSGQPGEDADIVLRAPTSIAGGQSPLIIIDGVITSGSLSDINPQDIADIEVVKGAAAASLYGSRAQAGVINITTKRGVTLDGTRYVFRSQYNANSLQNPVARTRHHPYKMTADGTQYARADGSPATRAEDRVLDDGADGSNAMRTFADNPYPPGIFRDVVDQFFTPGGQGSIYGAVEGRSGPFNYRLSASRGREEGVILYHDGTEQSSLRLNLDHQMRDNLSVSFSGYYASMYQDVISQGTSNIFRTLTNMDPSFDLLEVDPADGDLRPVVGAPGFATSNILYTLKTDDDSRKRDRYMGGVDLRFAPTSWLSIEGNASYDRNSVDEVHFRPSGFKRADTQTLEPLPPDPGRMSRSVTATNEMNASVTASVTQSFGDFTSRSRLRALYELHEEEWWGGGGTSFSVTGVPRLGLLTSLDNLDSTSSRTRAAAYFAITSLSYRARYLVDILGRRDGSSLFGENERWQNYYRVSGAWRMADEDWWPVDLITEFKPRYSIGTAGGRPRFEAQYQTYAVDRGQISPRILGNADLRPELAREQEFGLDAVLGNRVSITLNYVDTSVKDQILLTPLAGYYGFTAQWRNAGTLDSKTWEASVESAIIERPDLVWTMFLNADRSTQVISKLDVPDFQIRQLRATMYVVEGEPLGVYYGKRWATRCEDLAVSVDCGQFDVNDDGYLVYVGAGNTWQDGMSKGLWGTTGQVGGAIYDWGNPSPPHRGRNRSRSARACPISR